MAKKKAFKAKKLTKMLGGKKKVRKLLAGLFSPAQAGTTGSGAAAGSVMGAVAQYGGKNGLEQLKEDGLALVEMLRLWSRGEYKDVSAKSMIVITGSIAYFVSPVDLIPDWIPGSGEIDDAAVAMFAIYTLQQELERFREWQGNQGKRPVAVKQAA
jgi:uncharacterized membrane protein YkvA (DUF1232 family)